MTESTILRKEQCPSCAKKGNDTRKDNFVVYLNTDGSISGSCFTCGFSKLSGEYKRKYGLTEKKEISFPVSIYTKDQWIKDLTGYSSDPKGFRGLKKSTCVKYRVRQEFDEISGECKAQYYPVTKDYEFSGIKKRIVLPEKDFTAKGSVSKQCDLFGENVFKDSNLNSKQIILTSGELDCLSVYQMLNDYTQSRNVAKDTEYATPPVVSGIVGEMGNVNQYRLKYDFLNKFDKIIYVPDQDEAGQDALHKLAAALPKDKLFIITLPSDFKDPNEMLMAKKENEFIKAYWNAKAYNPAGIVGSSSLKERMKEDLLALKVPLPELMCKVQKMLAGGFKLEGIVNLGAASGAGKTTLVNEMIYFWIYNSPYKIGIVSLELSAPQYGVALGSRHLERKLNLFEDGEEAVQFIEQEENDKALDDLFRLPNGQDRFHLVDERDGGIKAIQDLVEKLIISCDCRVIILDPLQDVMAGLSIGQQEEFLAWMKSMIKRYKILFININHVRKSGNGSESNSEGAHITEEDFAGSSTIFKSAAVNWLFTRNKYLEEDNPYKNVVHSYLSKNRNTGLTGDAGDYYYDNYSHTLTELSVFRERHPERFDAWDAKVAAEKAKAVEEAKIKYNKKQIY